MHLDLIQSISLAGKAGTPNDDRIGCGDRHAWVIDGATDLGEPGLLGGRGGAAWLSAAAHRAFAGATGALPEICDAMFDAIAAAYLRERRREPVAAWELPSASFAAVAIEGDGLACAFAADCTVIHHGSAGTRYLTPAPDAEEERAQAAALGAGVGVAEVLLADRRASRERPRRVLGVDAAQSRGATEYRHVPAARGDELLLMSDGFAALLDAYAVYDPAGLLAAVRAQGLAALMCELRRIEAEDAACLRFPRFKGSDDASALWVRLG